MDTQTENVICVYDGKRALTALIKRDEITGKKLVYVAQEASADEIARLINPEHGAI